MIALVRVFVLFIAVVGGCGGKPHVNIPAPPPELTPGQRVDAFQHYRQRGEGVEIETRCGKGGCSSSSTDLLWLGDGTQIRYAEDLGPLLPAGSPAAIAAHDVDAVRRKKDHRQRIGLLMFGGCFIGSMVGFSKENDPLMYAGLAGALAGFVLFAHSSIVYNGEIKEKTRIVFDAYDQSLATRLNVCVNGLSVVPCESFTPGTPPPPEEADPALRSLRQK